MTEIPGEHTRLVREVHAAMSAMWHRQRSHRFHHLRQLDMSAGQMKTLAILWTSGRQTMGQLAEALDVSLGNVTGLVDGLVQRGLVRRDEDPTDRRQRLASLTPLAEARMRRMEEGNREKIEQLLRRLTLEDLRALRQGLQALAAAMESAAVLRRRSA